MIDSEQVPRGKGEKNPGEGSEIDLKPYAYKESEPARVTACLLKNEPTSLCMLQAKPLSGGAIGKPSVNSANLPTLSRWVFKYLNI